MDEQLRSLIQQKLGVIAREEDGILVEDLDRTWNQIDPSPHCPPLGEVMHSVNRSCQTAITDRGSRVANMLATTLANVKPACDKNLADELKALVDPIFPGDLHLAPALNVRGVYERRGGQSKFDERAYDLALTLSRAGSANASRDAKRKAHLAIDEYVLAAKGESGGGWDWLELKPNFYGIGLNLKSFFTRKRKPTND